MADKNLDSIDAERLQQSLRLPKGYLQSPKILLSSYFFYFDNTKIQKKE